MRGRRGSAQAPQYQVMIRVVPCVPDRYVLEQMGAHLPDAPVHGPFEIVLQLRLVPCEEVAPHDLQAFLR